MSFPPNHLDGQFFHYLVRIHCLNKVKNRLLAKFASCSSFPMTPPVVGTHDSLFFKMNYHFRSIHAHLIVKVYGKERQSTYNEVDSQLRCALLYLD